jgi:hypothetical protein
MPAAGSETVENGVGSCTGVLQVLGLRVVPGREIDDVFARDGARPKLKPIAGLEIVEGQLL